MMKEEGLDDGSTGWELMEELKTSGRLDALFAQN